MQALGASSYRYQVETVGHAGNDMPFDRHPSPHQVLGVVDALNSKQVKIAHRSVGWWQSRKTVCQDGRKSALAMIDEV